MGLSLYGPYAVASNTIRMGIIGDKKTVTQTSQLIDQFGSPVEGPTAHPLWTPSFPGMSDSGPLGSNFEVSDKWFQLITSDDMRKLEKLPHVSQRISFSVDLFFNALQNLSEREATPHVVVCAPPRRMMDLCIAPGRERYGRRKGRMSTAERRLVNLRGKLHHTQAYLSNFIPELKVAEQELLERIATDNFHHFLKARVMPLGIPTQMIRPYTLDSLFGDEKRQLQDLATIAWNFCVAVLYKAGCRPWRPATMAAGTCFVGISFYREKEVFGGKMGTSLAQVFTPEGEGLVLRGERVDWARGISPHLSKEAARRLLEKAINLYERQTRTQPSRLVVHKTSKFWEDELKGFRTALNGIPKHDFITITTRARRIRFYRAGYYPVLRGTMITLPDDTWLLYTKAYIPALRVYPGPRVPRPLEILQHLGDSPREVVNNEILGLTKLNWNSADFTSLQPITLQFARSVGRILREVPPGVTPQTKYLFYM